jgi:hypothetical protein
MPPSSDPKANHLLAALPAAEWQRWQPQLEWVAMPLGQVMYESGRPMSHVYFPTTSIVSLLYVMESGASAEIAVVGQEGLVGVSLFMGGESTPSRAVVQSAGHGFRLSSQIMSAVSSLRALRESPAGSPRPASSSPSSPSPSPPSAPSAPPAATPPPSSPADADGCAENLRNTSMN